MSNDLVKKAYDFAEKAHEGQFRRDKKTPYFTHPVAVAGIVRAAGGTDEEVAAALLHDVVEDTKHDIHEIRNEFGYRVADIVIELTDPDDIAKLPRTERKARQAEHIAEQSRSVRMVKMADQICNVRDILADVSVWKKTAATEYIEGADKVIRACAEVSPVLSKFYLGVRADAEELLGMKPLSFAEPEIDAERLSL